MRGTVSNKFIDQFLITSLVNRQWIKETIHKEYNKKLDKELEEFNSVDMSDFANYSTATINR